MISELRKKRIVTFFLWVVIIAFVGTIFLVWGVGGRERSRDYAIKINDQKISIAEYQQSISNMENTLKRLFNTNYDKVAKNFNIRERVKDELINNALLYEEATKKNIPVSPVEILDEIKKIPAFQAGGSFDERRYREILSMNGLNPSTFEENIKRNLLINKIIFLIKNSVDVTDREVKNEYEYRNKSAKITYLKISPKLFYGKVKIDEESLKQFFSENKENYRLPKQIKLKYTVLDLENSQNKEINVSEEEIQNYYISHRLDYYKPERLKVRHILAKVDNWDNKSEVDSALNKIKTVKDKLNKGTPFEVLAKNYSDDSYSAKKGGLIGTIKRGDIIKEFEEVAFSLKEGKVSDIVKTKFGYHLIKVDKRFKAETTPLDEKRDEIKEILIKEKKKTALRELALNLYRDILNEGNISAYLDSHPDKIKAYETKYFSKDETVKPLSEKRDVYDDIFNMQKSEVSKIYYINNKAYIFEVADIKKPYIPEFGTINEKIRKDYISSKSIEIANDEILNLINKGYNITKIAQEYNITPKATSYFKRVQPIPDIGSNTQLKNNIFTTKAGSILKDIFYINNMLYIVRVDDIKAADIKELTEDERKTIRDYIFNIKSTESLNEYLRNLRDDAEIEINPSLGI
ncbi:MAG: SurA N-terminal domain-containing protein [Deferribacterota bacterium]|nr:SurA N-terminal domain-containing protein [Deferribacterota bacterium]